MNPIIIIGAGMTGLMAGKSLASSDLPVIVLEKSRGVGGRLATRRFAGGVFDHGVNDFTIHDKNLREYVHEWEKRQLLTAWFSTVSQSGTMEPEQHYRGMPSMTAVPKDLAKTLRIERTSRVVSLKRTEDQWLVQSDEDEYYRGSAVILTPPLPQAVQILEKADISTKSEEMTLVHEIHYEPADMLLIHAPDAAPLPGTGCTSPNSDSILKVTDNAVKGITDTRGYFTVQCSQEFSISGIHKSDEEVYRELSSIIEDVIGAGITAYQIHRWRYSRPLNAPGIPYLEIGKGSNLFVAGDGLAGGSVQSAMISGLSVAEMIRSRIGGRAQSP